MGSSEFGVNSPELFLSDCSLGTGDWRRRRFDKKRKAERAIRRRRQAAPMPTPMKTHLLEDPFGGDGGGGGVGGGGGGEIGSCS